MERTRWAILGLAALLALGGAACGDSSSDADDGGTDTADVPGDVPGEDAPDTEPEAETEDEADVEVDAGDDAGREDSDFDAPDWGLPCPDPEAEFDPADPGVHMFFTIGDTVMMGASISLAAGGFLPAAREDFRPPDPPAHIPLDGCIVGSGTPSVRECTTSAECAPEQECVPETDASGNPIPDTGVCQTPRSTLDLGPFTCTGFATGDQTFQYNAGQSGAYTSTADGTLPAGTLAYDTTYVCTGDAAEVEGVGRYRLELYVPDAFAVTSPEPVTGGMGFPVLPVDPAAALALEWTGGDGTSELSLSLTGRDGGISCRVLDDGAFTIPADLVVSAGLAGIAMVNVLEMRRERTGLVCGEGISDGEATTTMALVWNVLPSPAEP
ncbi:MAG: hypothetical protein JXB32_23405 [Deltaproteobacteria bacterium]|nr:hypothetical protein [Deltaproteobacteria bacterium]